jgi:ribosome maturation factor RimP
MESSVVNQIKEKLEQLIEGSALFLVDLKIKPTNNIKIFLDGDNGVTIDAVSKNLGRKVEVTYTEAEAELTVEGVLKEASEEEIVLEETIGRKKEKSERKIPFSQIKKTVVQISF